jgi:hypothetical protein
VKSLGDWPGGELNDYLVRQPERDAFIGRRSTPGAFAAHSALLN